MTRITVRESVPDDLPAIEALYPAAFPAEDLLPLVRDLLRGGGDILSLVGIAGSAFAGHVIFTRCAVAGCTERAALLGPLCVDPAFQRRGIGSALVQAGHERLAKDGVACVLVLGDPGYYRRFGFAPEADIVPPYPLPAEWRSAWQSLALCPVATPLRGALLLADPWLRRSLWSA